MFLVSLSGAKRSVVQVSVGIDIDKLVVAVVVAVVVVDRSSLSSSGRGVLNGDCLVKGQTRDWFSFLGAYSSIHR